jgi:hypothetical protein
MLISARFEFDSVIYCNFCFFGGFYLSMLICGSFPLGRLFYFIFALLLFFEKLILWKKVFLINRLVNSNTVISSPAGQSLSRSYPEEAIVKAAKYPTVNTRDLSTRPNIPEKLELFPHYFHAYGMVPISQQ